MIKTLAKFLVAALLIGWLISSGKLDFSLVKRLISESNNWIYAIIFMVIQINLASFRWRALLKTKSKEKLPPLKLMSLNWIGQFFNTFLPGAVTGDLIKLLYARDLDKSLPKTFLVMTAFIDRILGLVGLIFLTGIFTILNYEEMITISPKMKALLPFNGLLFLGSLVFLTSLFLPQRLQEMILKISQKIPLLGSKIATTFEQVWSIGKSKSTVLFGVAISCVLQFGNIFCFWLVTEPFIDIKVPVGQLFTFIPIGMISTAIPISPAGLGVGHVIFEKLFKLVNINGGASLFNLFFVITVATNLLGAIPYLLSKKHSIKEADEFEHSEA
ncbi:hypothetical protein BIY24_13980 [Halobacteriovorax marinus]|uniref:lysylphosphatidylglycerol synthase transmembrane domain-containing protein n=1 Tax=Halobacteriovorax marinus TaxID=97084 RepID=UPI000BC35E7C|nr:lysylphosphatidylglycerol synthase transmembrane domain-containing protein [Halobacteriovorax marinus]ATH09015.1 hypothetical protein BIY24_13980 [Halobacteriovorax marinus]